ncbi:MAG TPA: hypothetical protein VIF57_17595 [Polyangia bacterium]
MAPQFRQRRHARVAIVALTVGANCAGPLVDARLHTQSGVTVACRPTPSPAGVNLISLAVKVTPRCTTSDITTEVLQAGHPLTKPSKSTEVIYANASRDVSTNPFPVQPAGTWLDVQVTVVCDHAGATKNGKDACQIGPVAQ